MSNVLECIPKLTDSVKIQLRNYIANESWNLGQASLELLCIGSLLSGKIKKEHNTNTLIDACFSEDWQTHASCNSSKLKKIYEDIFSHKENLIKTARSVFSAMKGGDTGTMIFSSKVKKILYKLKETNWGLLQEITETRTPTERLYNEVKSNFEAAFLNEVEILKRGKRKWIRVSVILVVKRSKK